MTDWVRLWHDMPTDPKWRTIARKSGQPLPCVIALFNLIMVNASGNADERGTLRNWDSEDAAAALDMEPEAVTAIMSAMEGKVLDGGRLTGWEKRQPKREDDGAAERKRAQRERERTQADAASRDVTQRHAPETETETETETERNTPKPPKGVVVPDWVPSQPWADFLEMRKRIKRPLTDRAKQLALSKLEALKADGHSPTDVLDQSVLNCWQDLFPPRRSRTSECEFTGP